MSVRSSRMAQIESLLVDDPHDPFLLYGLAMEYSALGDDSTAATKLLVITEKGEYVPAFLQAGQILNTLGRVGEACAVLKKGMDVAKRVGDDHAYSEMSALLSTIE